MTSFSSPPSPTSKSLYILTTSQTPLPTRYPRPHKPNLIIPPLIHRSLHTALDAKPPSVSVSASSSTSTRSAIIIPHPDSVVRHDVPSRTRTTSTNPPLTPESAGSIRGDEFDSEVTVKLHLVGQADPQTRAGWVTEALRFLAEYKGLGGVDTLLLGFKGVDYRGRKTVASEMFGCGAEGLESGSGTEVVDEEMERGVKEVWNLISNPNPNPNLSQDPEQNLEGGLGVTNLGTMYLTLGLLKELSEEKVVPKINAMDTPDCQSLPKEYSGFAREKGIELWAGGGGEGAGGSEPSFERDKRRGKRKGKD